MAVLLVVAKDQKEADSVTTQSRNYVSIGIEEKEIYGLINDIKWCLDKIDEGCADDFLYKLEIYGEEILSKERVEKYLNLSEVLLNEEVIRYLEENNVFEKYRAYYGDSTCLKKEDYIGFANVLKKICIQALEENKKIFVIGE